MRISALVAVRIVFTREHDYHLQYCPNIFFLLVFDILSTHAYTKLAGIQFPSKASIRGGGKTNRFSLMH